MDPRLILPVISLTCLFLQEPSAQNIDSLLNNKRAYHAVNIKDRDVPRIDGLLDEEVWSLGRWQGDFTQQMPRGGKPSTEDTWVKVLYDHANLYVAMVNCDSEPDKIRNILDRRDSRSGDMAGIALDSYYDKRTAFEFSMSAAGQKMDLKHLGDYSFDFNWDAVWDGATSINDTAWIAEMQLPFSQLRYADRKEQVWGLHFYRVISRKYEAVNWQWVPVESPAMVYLFGELRGIKDIRSSRQVEFLPYLLGSMNHIPAGDENNRYELNGGLNAKVGISSDYTLDLSVNPDFGQVEADPSVLNLTTFETFFEEKRPFFLEGNDVFDFEMAGDIPYYSRRIGSAPSFPAQWEGQKILEVPDRTTITGAAKLTGKGRKGLSVGLVNGLTARETGTATDSAGNREPIETAPLSNYLAARIKKEFREGKTIIGGVLSQVHRISSGPASKALLPDDALTGGLDVLHYSNDRNYYIELKSIASHLSGTPESILRKQMAHNHRFQRPDAPHLEADSLAEQLSGHGALIGGGKKGGKWNVHMQAQYRSPGLNLNDMGYIRESDYIGQRIEASYDMNQPGSWIRDYLAEVYQQARWSFGGENIRNRIGLNLDLRNNKLWSFSISLANDFSFLDTRELRGGPAIRHDGQVQLEGSAASNRARDLYAFAACRHTWFREPGFNEDMIHLGITWLPLRRLKFSAVTGLADRNYHQQYVATVSAASTTDYIIGNISRQTASLTFRSEVFLTPELSVQYYGSPYYSVGSYEAFRRVDRAQAKSTTHRWEILETEYDPASGTYSYIRNLQSFSFSNPDFSFMQFRSNLVLRWEYKLGSTLYLVWSHDRSGMMPHFSPLQDVAGDLLEMSGNHIVMLKINFWFSV